MSHDTHDHHQESHNDKPVLEFKSAFYFVIILAGLFIASIGFVQSMSHSESGHDAHATQHGDAHGTKTHDATNHEEGHAEATPATEKHEEAEHSKETEAAEHH